MDLGFQCSVAQKPQRFFAGPEAARLSAILYIREVLMFSRIRYFIKLSRISRDNYHGVMFVTDIEREGS